MTITLQLPPLLVSNPQMVSTRSAWRPHPEGEGHQRSVRNRAEWEPLQAHHHHWVQSDPKWVHLGGGMWAGAHEWGEGQGKRCASRYTLLPDFPCSLVPRLLPSRVPPHNSHYGYPISELTSGIKSRETKTALRGQALRESFPKDCLGALWPKNPSFPNRENMGHKAQSKNLSLGFSQTQQWGSVKNP